MLTLYTLLPEINTLSQTKELCLAEGSPLEYHLKGYKQSSFPNFYTPQKDLPIKQA